VLPRNVAVRHLAVPITLAHDVLTVALADPTNVLALDDIRLATKLSSVRTAVATASDLQEAVNRYYGGTAASGGVADTFGALADVEGLEATEDKDEELEQVRDVDDAPVVRLVNAIMGEALHSRIRLERLEADTRVSSMPTMHGETVVIRLLRKESEKAKTIAEIGLAEHDREAFERALSEPQGLVLITGPTGSGKTSSLYAGLATVIRPDINVVTLWSIRWPGSTRCRSTSGWG
jgi:type IV pilus assembly protein PilB